MTGFIKYMRTEEAEFLLKYPNANHLFSVMAYRARRTDHPMNGLKAGQCFLGDYSAIGLTERQYRTAKKQLSDWNLATFKGTNKGTVGTIINSKVYDINEEARDGQGDRQATGKRRLTKNERMEEGINTSLVQPEPEPSKSKFKYSPDDMKLAEWMWGRVTMINPSMKKPNLENWANTIRLMNQIDKRSHQDISRLFDWANKDSFWCDNILSPQKLRKQFDTLTTKVLNDETNRSRKSEQGDRKLSSAESKLERIRQRNSNNGVSGRGDDSAGIYRPDIRRDVCEPMGSQKGSTYELDDSGWQDVSGTD